MWERRLLGLGNCGVIRGCCSKMQARPRSNWFARLLPEQREGVQCAVTAAFGNRSALSRECTNVLTQIQISKLPSVVVLVTVLNYNVLAFMKFALASHFTMNKF